MTELRKSESRSPPKRSTVSRTFEVGASWVFLFKIVGIEIIILSGVNQTEKEKYMILRTCGI